MSRPFSYNDDNFTVISNMLFIHIQNPLHISTTQSDVYELSTVIPEEIRRRIISQNTLVRSYQMNNKSNSFFI